MPYKLLCLHNCDKTNINFYDAFDIDTFDDIDITTQFSIIRNNAKIY